MKTLIASLVAVAAISTAASAGGHGHRHHHHHHHFVKRYVEPVYVAPVKCHYVYNHGYATKVCHKVYGH